MTFDAGAVARNAFAHDVLAFGTGSFEACLGFSLHESPVPFFLVPALFERKVSGTFRLEVRSTRELARYE